MSDITFDPEKLQRLFKLCTGSADDWPEFGALWDDMVNEHKSMSNAAIALHKELTRMEREAQEQA
jgi:hypothetical protein